MLRSLKQLYGDKLGASDGDIGHVKDFYFDDRHWVVRYVIADTGNWQSGRLVLISPQAFGHLYEDHDCLLVNLTRDQVANSPSIDLHKPLSRQIEEEYYRYFGWPFYWNGNGIWGGAPFPAAPSSRRERPIDPESGNDPHLRSGQAIGGYAVQASDGELGRVSDFMIDDASWEIAYVVVEPGDEPSGKIMVITPDQIDRISYDESKVFLNGTKETIQSASDRQMPRATYHDARSGAA